jgi:hypothetical protein
MGFSEVDLMSTLNDHQNWPVLVQCSGLRLGGPGPARLAFRDRMYVLRTGTNKGASYGRRVYGLALFGECGADGSDSFRQR